jgi:hypothetical protein
VASRQKQLNRCVVWVTIEEEKAAVMAANSFQLLLTDVLFPISLMVLLNSYIVSNVTATHILTHNLLRHSQEMLFIRSRQNPMF